MITVLNNSKAVIALKALGHKNLRLFPGANNVLMSEKDFGVFTGNAAVKGYLSKRVLQVVSSDSLTEDEKTAAAKAKEKNDKLNKGQKPLQPKKEPKKKVKAEE